MDKMTLVLFIIWMVFAVAAFVSSFWAAGLVKFIGLVFGGLNSLIIFSWVITLIQGLIQNKKIKELKEN